MGEVYRARDTRLGRDVAIKVLPAHLGSQPEVRVRFEREARTISSLNHPHICVLHDVGREGETDYLVMEKLDGETLAERLTRGMLPIGEVLELGGQIADALDRAHRAGVVHRDLKPGNVMLTRSGAKLMDFGLARPTGMGGTAAMTQPPTMAAPLTAEGSIVGTFQYMAPEQLEGKDVDARSDLWALGCVLYEMATGKRAFEGSSQASLISAILRDQPRTMSEISPVTPPAFSRMVEALLAKNPDDRVQTAHDVMLQLRWIAESRSQASGPPLVARRRFARERIAWVVAAATLLSAIALGIAQVRRPAPESPLVQFAIETPLHKTLFPFDTKGMAISPDGARIVFAAEDLHGKVMLYVHDLATAKSVALPGTEGASYPFWSPDSRQIGFFANHSLNRIDARGGPVDALCEAPSGRGGTWNRDGVIVFAPALGSALYRISAGGGRPERVTMAQTQARWPVFLPDGTRFLYTNRSDLVAGSLDGMPQKMILSNVSNAVFVAPDQVVFSRGTLLMAQAIDPRTLTVRGEPVTLPFGSVAHLVPKDFSVLSASANGALAFLPSPDQDSRLVWLDAKGREDGEVGDAGGYDDAALSPDAQHIAVVRRATEGSDLWLLAVAGGRLSRFTFHPGTYGSPCWSRDGRQLAFFELVDGIGQIRIKWLDGSERTPLPSRRWQIPYDFSPDARNLLTYAQSESAASDIYTMSLGSTPTLTPFLATPFDEAAASFSPDGKWVAYQSNASLRNEIYVRRYPPTDEQWQISNDGGESPRWSADGHWLYYMNGDQLMRAPIGGGATPNAGTPRLLFRIRSDRAAPRITGSVALQMISGISADQQRFLFRLGSERGLPSINVVLNWRKALHQH